MATATSCAQNVYHLPENENHHQNDHSNNNNNIRARTRVREKCLASMNRATAKDASEELGQRVLDAYRDAIGRPMPGCIANEALSYVQKGLDRDLIIAALEYTAAAPRPAWAYTRYMLGLAYQRGCKSYYDFLELTGQDTDF